MDYKPLPIGIDNYEEIIEKGYYYVDKTMLIQKLLDSTAKVTIFTRPRRFGKSLNLSMLQYFFETNDSDNARLFEKRMIAKAGDNYTKHMGKYPVIMLNFKEGKQLTFLSSYTHIKSSIVNEFNRHKELLTKYSFEQWEIEKYSQLMSGVGDIDLYVDSIKFLTQCLEKAYGEKVILLLDEYDVPLENAYFKGFYDEMIAFIRGVLSGALKTNNSLFMAVLTGCLRISKESIFTGLNNLEIVSIENKAYGEYFGFTEEEVEEMLVYYQRQHRSDTVKEWYNGYLFGRTRIYNPWSMVNYMKSLLTDENEYPKPYWSNTSSNSIVKDLIERSDAVTKSELEILMAGGTIEKLIHEDITYEEIYSNMNNLWNFLYFTGYLKKISERFEEDCTYVTLQIPNKEVGYIYKMHIMGWMESRIRQTNLSKLYESTIAGDVENIENEIDRILESTVSYYDTNNSKAGESFYHGIMVGLYAGISDYQVLSNRESGNGRPDLIIKYPSFKGKAYIIEFKITTKHTELEEAARKALLQIDEQNYRDGLLADGYTDITVYGIGFYKKSCLVLKG
ncbi:MAG: AAA family ATPase [Eubacteriales bacterium]